MFTLRLMNHQTEEIPISEELDLLSSLRSAGQDPICDCGGEGHCYKCKARLIAGPLTTMTDLEKQALSIAEQSSGWFLMCQRKPLGDLIIDMPQRDGVRVQTDETEINTAITPWVKKEVIDFSDLSAGQTADYRSVLLEKFAIKGVEDITDQALRELSPALSAGHQRVTVVYSDQILSVEAGDTTDFSYGVVCDLGTATIGLELIDLARGRRLGKVYAGNSQRAFGGNRSSRVKYVNDHEENCSELTHVTLYTINKLIREICQHTGVAPEHIYHLVFAGNPQMIHLLFGITPRDMEEMQVFLHLPPQSAKEVGLLACEMAQVSAIGALSGAFGGDVAAVSYEYLREGTCIVDMGIETNLLLKTADGTVTRRCLLTPVLDGMNLHQGMMYGSGAAEGVYLDETTQNIFPRLPDAFSAKGVSGLGLFGVYRDLRELGYLSAEGRFLPEQMPEPAAKRIRDGARGKEMLLAGGGFFSVVITEEDFQVFGQTVRALRQEMEDLLTDAAVDRLILTGPAGAMLDLAAAEALGLLPTAIDPNRISFQPELVLTAAEAFLLRGRV